MARLFIVEPFRCLAGGRGRQTVGGSTLMEVQLRMGEELENTPVREESEVKIFTVLAGGL